MIIVKRNKGDVVFLNEKEFVEVGYEKDLKKVTAYAKEDSKHTMVEITGVQDITFVNDSQPTIMRFGDVEKKVDDDLMKMRLRDLDVDLPFHWARLVNAVRPRGIETVGDLLKHSPLEVEGYPKCGIKCVRAVKKMFKEKYNIEWQ